MIQRENFRNRWEAGARIGVHELLYPLMQGYDSFAIRADVELGGTDQLFNVMAGRKLQQAYGQTPQNIVLISMVMGLDGRKMSTSWGNTIFINDAPVDQYGKIMSVSDEMIVTYLESCTELPMAEVRRTAGRPGERPRAPEGSEEAARLADRARIPRRGRRQLRAGRVREGLRAARRAQRGARCHGAATETRLVDCWLLTGQAPSKARRAA